MSPRIILLGFSNLDFACAFESGLRQAGASAVVQQKDLRLTAARFEDNFSSTDLFVTRFNHRPPHATLPEVLQRFFEREEWSNAIYGLSLDDGEKQFYNAPMKARVAGSKPVQLRTAGALGLRIPRTLITNSRAAAAEFVAGLGVAAVIKPMDCSVAPNPRNPNDTLLLFTREITAGQIHEMSDEDFAGSPIILQECIQKRHELRVVVCGGQGVSIVVDSQRHASSATDWRRRQSDGSMYSYGDLEAWLEQKLAAYLKAFHLQTGVFDLAVTPDGETVFFECNPNGQWHWLDEPLGGRVMSLMARSVVDYSLGRTHDEHSQPIAA
jgi:glutathione synthase/RimK-type ligase-like ATP-grasp enzyme